MRIKKQTNCVGDTKTQCTGQICSLCPAHDFRAASYVHNVFSPLYRVHINFCTSFTTPYFISCGILFWYLTFHKSKYSNHDWGEHLHWQVSQLSKIIFFYVLCCSSLKIQDSIKHSLPQIKWHILAMLIYLPVSLLNFSRFSKASTPLKNTFSDSWTAVWMIQK